MNLKITIPKPCHENWNGMTPDEKGRFCRLCAKSVVDFTAMPRTEVESYLIENSGTKICGHFNNSQIDNGPVTLRIPREALYRQTGFRNIFLLALVISMGTTLFSCQKRTIGEIAMPDDSVQADSTPRIKVQNETDPPICGAKPGDTLTEVKLKPIKCTGVTLGAVAVAPPEPEIIEGESIYFKPVKHRTGIYRKSENSGDSPEKDSISKP